MHPEAFQLWPLALEVRPYSFFMLLAAAVVITTTAVLLKRIGWPLKRSLAILLLCAVSMLVGARLLHAVVNLPAYLADPGKLFTFKATGFALYGGVVLAVAVGALFIRIRKLPFWPFADRVVLALGLGVAVMRIGCFLNGCCFGKETDLPWGATFPILSYAHQYQLASGTGSFFHVNPVHPTQLYELAAALVAALIAAVCLKRKATSGTAALLAAIWFTAFRAFNWNLRVPPPTFDMPSYFYPVLYAAIIAACLFFLARRMRTRSSSPLRRGTTGG